MKVKFQDRIIESSQAYMLVYTRRITPEQDRTIPTLTTKFNVQPPIGAQEVIKALNDDHEGKCEEYLKR